MKFSTMVLAVAAAASSAAAWDSSNSITAPTGAVPTGGPGTTGFPVPPGNGTVSPPGPTNTPPVPTTTGGPPPFNAGSVNHVGAGGAVVAAAALAAAIYVL